VTVPCAAPPRSTQHGRIPLRDKLRTIVALLPTATLIFLVLGTIYGDRDRVGRARRRRRDGFRRARRQAHLAHAQRVRRGDRAHHRNDRLILFGAYVLNFIFVGLGVPQALAKLVSGMPLPPWGIMLLIIGFYLALGTFMEGFSMVVTTIPVVFPVVLALGYDPIWFGVIVTVLVEIALISPPDVTVLYVLQGMRRDDGPITDIFSGLTPFVLVYVLAVLAARYIRQRRPRAEPRGDEWITSSHSAPTAPRREIASGSRAAKVPS
jgi:TRAP-type mannitol/chloroaromatic compound transport system permease large subunit